MKGFDATAATALILYCILASAPSFAGTSDADHGAQTMALRTAVQGPCRTRDNIPRDAYRHPLETLQFFGITPAMHVIEITPGYGWYAEILSPYLIGAGDYIAAVHVPSRDPGGPNELLAALRTKFSGSPQCFRAESIRAFDIASPTLGRDGSADLVLTFRNVHNWEQDGYSEKMFLAIARALKPGGVLGVTDHRADGSHPAPGAVPAGYISEARVIALAAEAGLQFEGGSEINGNPRDRKDYPAGVWTLPPTLTLGEQDRRTYLRIGESDRMTLKFRKPAAASRR